MFLISLQNVVLALLYAVPGYILCKCKRVRAEHLSTLSSILIYVLSPCMVVNAFLSFDFSLSNLGYMGLFFAVSLTLQIAFLAIVFLLLRKKYADAKYRVLTIATVLGNVGFFGLPVIKALFPQNPEVACYSSIYVITMNVLVFTVGVFCLTGNKKFMTLRSALLNPSTIAFYVAIPLYAFGVKQYLPQMLLSGLNLLSAMTTPVCMLILGIRLATVPLKSVFGQPIVYAACLGKQILFPLFAFLFVFFLPLPFSFKASALVLSGVPCASVILNMAEIHHSETELSANCVLMSTALSFLTIPLLTLLTPLLQLF